MALSTIPLLHSPAFPHVYEGNLLDQLIGSVDHARAGVTPAFCEFECADSQFPCHLKAIVTHLSSELALCAKHYREVERG